MYYNTHIIPVHYCIIKGTSRGSKEDSRINGTKCTTWS